MTGVAPAGSGLRPSGAEPQDASQAEPLVPNAAHTPLPWGISNGYAFSASAPDECATYVCGPDPKSIGIKLATPWIEDAWDGDAEAKANAAFIVRACNSHYELIGALAALVDPCLSYHGNNIVITCDSHGWAMKRVKEARDALAKARGETL